MNSAVVQSVQVTVLIQLTVGANDSRSLKLKRKKMTVGDHSIGLQLPMYLRQGSILHIEIRENRLLGGRTHTQSLSPDTIWLASSRNFPIHLDDPNKRIWLNVVELPSIPPPDASGSGQDSPAPENFSCAQEEAEESLRAAGRNLLQKLGDLKTTLERLVGKEHTMESVEFGAIVSELCSSSKAAFGSVSAFYEQIKTQGEGDRELLALAMSAERTVNLVQPTVKDIAESSELKKTLQMFPYLMKETVDLFETWAKQGVLASSVLIQPNKDRVEDLNKRYTILEEEFSQGIQIDATAKMQPSLKEHELKELKGILLDGIKTVQPKASRCIPGTRTTILEGVETKIDDPDGANILWIHGAPGSGKSSLSLSAKSRLRDQGRLLTYYRFDRNESTTTTAIALWRCVAYDLACQFPAVGTRILQHIRSRNFDFDSPMTVFTSLVETPLSQFIDLPTAQSLVIVVDALDECGGSDGPLSLERQEFLQTLRLWPRLPKHIKLLVTSRQDNDIIIALSSISTAIHIPSGSSLIENPEDSASIAATNDILTFLEYRFFKIRTQLNEQRDWPGTRLIGGMVCRAAGNFMWATAAANFIEKGVNPKKRLDKIMSDGSASNSPLYSLYHTILQTAFENVDDSEAVILRAVFGTMICAKRTLSDDEYTKLPTQERISHKILASIRWNLGSVIVTDGNLRFVHKSFDDFLHSPQCPPEYAVTIDASHHLLTNLCLATMKDGLRFNICHLETSCLKNTDVPNIKNKIADNISPLLSYSCSFWADHLSLAPFDQYLIGEVKAMAMDKLLYWFEAMSLLKEINRVSPSILLVLNRLHSSPDDELKDFLSDAREFIAAFGTPIAQSAPHIYISALPFAPENSLVARHYLPRFPGTLALTAGKPTDWPLCIFVVQHGGHCGPITSVTLSPDESYIVSGSASGNYFINDSEFGNRISGPVYFRDQRGFPSVFFDPDGQYVWVLYKSGGLFGFDPKTGEKHRQFEVGNVIGFCRCNGDQCIISVEEATVTLWSADTGVRLHNLSMGINSGVYLATLSPDGCRIAGVMADDRKTVRMWKLVDGSEIHLVRGPSDGQLHARASDDISALSFSVDGDFVVGGSCDGTTLIWDAGTGDAVIAPLSISSHDRVCAVAYSHATGRLFSLSEERTVTIWNTTTCEAVLGPLGEITSIALSRDGRRALLGGTLGRLTKWNLDRKGNVPAIEPEGPCMSRVLCFAFSPCGMKLASLHYYPGILFWDASTYEPIPGHIKIPFKWHKFIFSPDGSRLVTYDPLSGDVGVQVWNAHTGELAFHQNFDGHTWIRHAAFRSTDQRLVACSDSNIHVWNMEDSAPPPIAAKLPTILALSSDGLTVLVRDNDGIPRHYMWSTTTHQSLPLTLADGESVINTHYSSTGTLLAVTFSKTNPGGSTLRVWNTQNGDLAADPWTIHGFIGHLAFSHDNSYIAFSRDWTMIWIWDVRTGCLASKFWSMHASRITRLNFSPDGERLVSGSEDGQIRVWNTAHLLGNSPPAFVGLEFFGFGIFEGWVRVTSEKVAFWVPPDNREKLAWNEIIALRGGSRLGIQTRVDLTKFKYGENWMECFGEAK